MVGLKQEMRQSQSLVMTQQLQQSIKLLQLSALELQEYIDTEIEKNPLLTKEEAEGEAEKPEVSPDETPAEESTPESRDAAENQERARSLRQRLLRQ